MGSANLTLTRKGPRSLHLSGRIDTLTSSELRRALSELGEGQGNGNGAPVTLDLSGVNYISSSGLREFLVMAKGLGEDKLLLENVLPEVEEILRTTGFSDIFRYTAKPAGEPAGMDLQKMSLTDLLTHRVREDGGRTFIKSGGVEYTWRDIDRGVSAIAEALYALNVREKSHVALCGANSVNWILTFFAIQKLGAIAILLNPQLTAEEVATISRIGDITHFCLGWKKTPAEREAFVSRLTGAGKDKEDSPVRMVFDISDGVDFLGKKPAWASLSLSAVKSPMPDDVCVMIFTSGSTGTPKGVLLSATNLLTSANYCVRNLRMTEEDRMCAILPLFHIFGLTAALLASVISGSSLVLPRSVKPDELMSVINGEKCTVLHSVPTVLLRIVNAPGFSPDLVASLRASYLSGAPVSESQLEMLMGKFPNNHFVRRYGLTEMTPVSATGFEEDAQRTLKTVGKPLEGTDVRIKDLETGAFCPTGTQGEIVVRGHNLMCGYYKLPVEKQPFDTEGYLHTGDLGFLDEEGYLHFTGRAKELIIRGGENIMPDEVASAISAHESVAEVKVVGVPDETYGEAVVAAVALKSGASFDEAEMRDFLTARLAKYKIPSYFFVYDRLPSLANGKIDAVTLRKELADRVV